MNKNVLIAMLLLSLIVTSLSYFVIREKDHNSTIDGCVSVGTSDHGFPLALYKKTNENFSTYASINDSHNSPVCKAFIRSSTVPAVKVDYALVDLVFWSAIVAVAYTLVIYLSRNLTSPNLAKAGLAMSMLSLLIGLGLASLSYQTVRESSRSSEGPCPTIYIEKRGYPLGYHERYSASCIEKVGFYEPDKFFLARYLVDAAAWSSLALGGIFVIRKSGALHTKPRRMH